MRDAGRAKMSNTIMIMSDLIDLQKKVVAFRDARNWQQFHNPKDCAISLALEAAEVLEHFQWKNKEEVQSYITESKSKIGEELSDVLYWVLLMSHDLGINILTASKEKLKQNARKYPIEKARGKSTKYNKL